MKKPFLLLFLSFTSLFIFAQHEKDQQSKQAKIACIAFYNLENLFDTIDDPRINDEEFTPGSTAQWDTPKYKSKLKNLAGVISQIGEEYIKGGPVILGISEVENRQVVEDLIATPPLNASGYQIVHYNSPDRRGIDVALIYRAKYFTVAKSKVFPLILEDRPDFVTRDILLVSGILDGDTMHLLVNHWPSRSGGEKETAPLRNAAADNCLRAVTEIRGNDPGARIIIMGDLNDDPGDESLVKHLKTKNKTQGIMENDLFNPMWQLYKNGIGSLAYRDSWNLFDQMIISASFLDKEPGRYYFLKASVFNRKYLLQKEGQYAGYPYRTYAGGVYMGGFSDHLPVYLFLVKEK